jgi:hypothetical protein
LFSRDYWWILGATEPVFLKLNDDCSLIIGARLNQGQVVALVNLTSSEAMRKRKFATLSYVGLRLGWGAYEGDAIPEKETFP